MIQWRLMRRQDLWFLKIISKPSEKQKQPHFNPSLIVMRRKKASITCSKRNPLLNSQILQSSYVQSMKTTHHPHPCDKSCWSNASIKSLFPDIPVQSQQICWRLTMEQGPLGFPAYWCHCGKNHSSSLNHRSHVAISRDAWTVVCTFISF